MANPEPAAPAPLAQIEDPNGLVCRVEPDGEVVCKKPLVVVVPPAQEAAMQAAIAAYLAVGGGPPPPPEKMKLALLVSSQIFQSAIADDWIPFRSFEIQDSVDQLLQNDPPSMLTYNYTDLPGEIMSTYLLKQGKMMAMYRVMQMYSGPNKKSKP